MTSVEESRNRFIRETAANEKEGGFTGVCVCVCVCACVVGVWWVCVCVHVCVHVCNVSVCARTQLLQHLTPLLLQEPI